MKRIMMILLLIGSSVGLLCTSPFIIQKKQTKKKKGKLCEVCCQELGDLARSIPQLQKNVAAVQQFSLDTVYTYLENSGNGISQLEKTQVQQLTASVTELNKQVALWNQCLEKQMGVLRSYKKQVK